MKGNGGWRRCGGSDEGSKEDSGGDGVMRWL